MFNEKVTEMMARAMKIIEGYTEVPTKSQMEYWEASADRISVSTQEDNMDASMTMLSRLKADADFASIYAALTPDERSYITLMLIASEDLKTLRAIDAYDHHIKEIA